MVLLCKMLTTPLTIKAAKFAYEKHTGQFDKQGMPYIIHPLEVASKLETEEEIVVALLHDTLEDTETTYDELVREFGESVAKNVEILTRKSDETYKDYIRRVSKTKLTKRVKIADLYNNTDEKRGPIPDSLKQRYEKAIKYLTNN